MVLHIVGDVVQGELGVANGGFLGFGKSLVHAHTSLVPLGHGGCHLHLIWLFADCIGAIHRILEDCWENWPLFFHQIADDGPLVACLDKIPGWVTLGYLHMLAGAWPLATMLEGLQKCRGVAAGNGQVA